MTRTGIYPGTFDPITVGHMDIIERSLSIVDHLVIGVAKAHHKAPLFILEERINLIKQDIRKTNNSSRIDVIGFDGLLVDFAQEQQAQLIIRGLRAVSDFEYEFQLASMNTRMNGNVQTVFLTASENCQFVASKLVKEAARLGGDISSFVSAEVAAVLQQKLHQKNLL